MAKDKSLKQRVKELEDRMLNNEKVRAHILTTLDDMKISNAKKIDNLGRQVEKLNTSVTDSFKSLDKSVNEIKDSLIPKK